MSTKKLEHIEALLEEQKLKEAKKKLKALSKGRPFTAPMNYLAYKIEAMGNSFQRAYAHISLACQQEPSNPEYLATLGDLLFKTNEYKEAEKCFTTCISLEPTSAGYWTKYGNSKQFQDHFDEAERAFRKAIDLDSGAVEAYLSLARLKQYLRLHDEAVEILAKAQSASLSSSELTTLRGQILQEMGKTQEANESYLQAYRSDPKSLESMYYLSMAEPSSISEDILHDIRCGQFIGAKNLVSRQFILAANARSKQDYKGEVDHLKMGHKLFRKNLSNAEERRRNTLDKLIQFPNIPKQSTISVSLIEHDVEPVFIVGPPRSGSTLLESLLATSTSEPTSLEECGVFSYAASVQLMNKVDAQLGHTITLDDSFVRLVCKSYQEKGLRAGTRRFTDKSLENIFFVDLVLSIFPSAKFFYCSRNPVASLVSILQNNLTSLSWAHDIPAILAYIDATRRAAELWEKRFPNQFFNFNYERFVLNPNEMATKIFEFCGLQWTPDNLEQLGKNKVSQTASNVQIRQGINTKGLKRYLNYIDFFQDYSEQYSWLSKNRH